MSNNRHQPLPCLPERHDHLLDRQRIGGAAAWLGAGGLLVPSARAVGGNMVIIVTNNELEDELRIITSEVIDQLNPR